MPRSSSEAPSDSSHDSESPRKRAPSVSDDRMDIDQISVDGPFGICGHILTLTGSPKMLAWYGKALAWSGVKYGTDHPHSKRRKVSFCSVLPTAILTAR
jgi:hypothetical protein